MYLPDADNVDSHTDSYEMTKCETQIAKRMTEINKLVAVQRCKGKRRDRLTRPSSEMCAGTENAGLNSAIEPR